MRSAIMSIFISTKNVNGSFPEGSLFMLLLPAVWHHALLFAWMFNAPNSGCPSLVQKGEWMISPCFIRFRTNYNMKSRWYVNPRTKCHDRSVRWERWRVQTKINFMVSLRSWEIRNITRWHAMCMKYKNQLAEAAIPILWMQMNQ